MVTLNDSVKSQLNKYQIQFIELAWKRAIEIDEIIDGEDNPEIRLLYIKELYGIFCELNKINFKRNYPDGEPRIVGDDTLNWFEIRDDLLKTVSFIRNVLAHFPLFKTWDDVWISKDFAKFMNVEQNDNSIPKKKPATIEKFITDSNDRTSFTYKLTMNGGTEERVFSLIYPKNKTDEDKIYLKDMLTEKDGVFSVITIISKIF